MNPSNTFFIQVWWPDIIDMSFEEFVKAKVDFQMFRLPEGIVSENLTQTFERLMIDTGLLISPNTGQNWTLYSFRHIYATFALLNDGMDIHTLAIQMGTSIAMIERPFIFLIILNMTAILWSKNMTEMLKRVRKSFFQKIIIRMMIPKIIQKTDGEATLTYFTATG